MFDLKVINSVLGELEEERGIPRARMIDAIEQALATAYKKEFGKRGQIVRTHFDEATGTAVFEQIKIVLDESMIKEEDDESAEGASPDASAEAYRESKANIVDDNTPDSSLEESKVRFDEEKHIMIDTARLIKKDVQPGDELVFPLEPKDDFGRIAAQTAKQVIIQKIREAEKDAAMEEFGQKEGDIIMGHVQRFERGNLYVDLGRVTGAIPYDEQIPGERFRPGERIRALLLHVDETARGIYLRLSRAHPDFLEALFAVEAPELQSGSVEVKAIAREAGSRSKIAVFANEAHLDPVGSLVGQRGVRVSTVMSELGGEKIDIIEWSPDPVEFIEDALSPAQVLEVRIESEPNEETGERGHAVVEVSPDQQSLAIGRGGQNVRLAAKLTGWKIDIVSAKGEELAEADGEEVVVAPETEVGADIETLESEEPIATTTKDELSMTDDEPTEDRDPKDFDEEEEIDTPEEAEAQLSEEETEEKTETDEEKS